MAGFVDDFDGDALDEAVWTPHYLPAWSSRAATRATLAVERSRLSLWIPPEQGLWCADDHPEPLRVSGIQSGTWSGPLGSSRGQQAFRPGLVVREEQPRRAGWLPTGGRVAVTCRMDLSPRSMAAVWLCGFEEQPDDAGELCVVEVFGRSLRPGSAEVGVGVKQLGDPRLAQDFVQPRLPVEVGELHEYAVEWDREVAVFSVDDREVHRAVDPPTYPMQVMVAVFDFPSWSAGGDDHLVPRLEVERITGSA